MKPYIVQFAKQGEITIYKQRKKDVVLNQIKYKKDEFIRFSEDEIFDIINSSNASRIPITIYKIEHLCELSY